MLAPFTPMILDGAELTPGPCSTSAAAAAPRRSPRRGAVASGSVLGADLSAPMLDRAWPMRRCRARERRVRGGRRASAPVRSRDVRRGDLSFRSDVLRGSGRGVRERATRLRPEGRIVFACWQPLTANPWYGLPRSAALEHVPPPAALPADAPGPFALADPDRTRLLLRDSGWHDIDIAPATRRCCSVARARSTRRSSSCVRVRWTHAPRERRRGVGDACARRGARHTHAVHRGRRRAAPRRDLARHRAP